MTPKNQAEIDRAQALADFHKAERTGNADLNMTGEPNNTPERLTAHLRPLLTNKGDPADHPGATLEDPFNRSLDLPDDKFAPLGQGLKCAGEKAVTPFTQSDTISRDRSKSPLAMNKSDLGYDPRTHH